MMLQGKTTILTQRNRQRNVRDEFAWSALGGYFKLNFRSVRARQDPGEYHTLPDTKLYSRDGSINMDGTLHTTNGDSNERSDIMLWLAVAALLLAFIGLLIMVVQTVIAWLALRVAQEGVRVA